DGIRDWSVTGVQTCALPISSGRGDWSRRQRGGGRTHRHGNARQNGTRSFLSRQRRFPRDIVGAMPRPDGASRVRPKSGRGARSAARGVMRILVATDGSRGSAAALSFAIRLATREAASELIVVTVDAAEHSPAAVDEDVREAQRRAQRVLDAAAREMNRLGAAAKFRRIPARGRDGIPEAISREADRLRADLVVVGSEGRDTLSEWILGGTALRLIYLAR